MPPLAKSSLLHLEIPGPQMGQHQHLDLAAKDSTPLTFRIISRYITFFTIPALWKFCHHRRCYC